jgi:hypothetical protein
MHKAIEFAVMIELKSLLIKQAKELLKQPCSSFCYTFLSTITSTSGGMIPMYWTHSHAILARRSQAF